MAHWPLHDIASSNIVCWMAKPGAGGEPYIAQCWLQNTTGGVQSRATLMPRIVWISAQSPKKQTKNKRISCKGQMAHLHRPPRHLRVKLQQRRQRVVRHDRRLTSTRCECARCEVRSRGIRCELIRCELIRCELIRCETTGCEWVRCETSGL